MTQITKRAAAFAGSFFVVKFILPIWDVLCFCCRCSVSFPEQNFRTKISYFLFLRKLSEDDRCKHNDASQNFLST